MPEVPLVSPIAPHSLRHQNRVLGGTRKQKQALIMAAVPVANHYAPFHFTPPHRLRGPRRRACARVLASSDDALVAVDAIHERWRQQVVLNMIFPKILIIKNIFTQT